jgi:hypothetical protein
MLCWPVIGDAMLIFATFILDAGRNYSEHQGYRFLFRSSRIHLSEFSTGHSARWFGILFPFGRGIGNFLIYMSKHSCSMGGPKVTLRSSLLPLHSKCQRARKINGRSRESISDESSGKFRPPAKIRRTVRLLSQCEKGPSRSAALPFGSLTRRRQSEFAFFKAGERDARPSLVSRKKHRDSDEKKHTDRQITPQYCWK